MPGPRTPPSMFDLMVGSLGSGGPVQTPRPFDPNAASVFDTAMMQAGRRLQGAMDTGELQRIAMMNGPAIARVPREETAALLSRLAQSWGGTPMPSALEQALQTLAQRFPRMLSHIERVGPTPLKAPDTLAGAANPVAAPSGRVAELLFNPNAPDSALDTMTHELTHGGQMLRAADRGVEFTPLYRAQTAEHGYAKNPFEMNARTAEYNQLLRRSNLPMTAPERLDMARDWARYEPTMMRDELEAAATQGPAKLDQSAGAALDIQPADPNTFANGIATLNRKARANTSVYTPEELSQMQLYMVRGANAGYGIKNGDELVNVFNNGGMATFGRARELVQDAVQRGARRLDCFDGPLVQLYESAGFKEVGRSANWTPGGPDVVFMEWVGGPGTAGTGAGPVGVAGAGLAAR